ncbi:MAG: GNAT family N-acetyltransferase [Armatimonadetes bacterium]|nr:GNAT family N-acetyltransferase [Armatimonadota bacterium]
MNNIKIREPVSKEEFEQYYNLRWRILRQPWNQPFGREKDDKENQSIHIIACIDDKIVGCGRGHFNSQTEAQIRFMAVEAGFQGKGFGAKILKALENKLTEKGAKSIILNARKNAVFFYKKLGYEIVEKSHTMFGEIEHFKMKKEIQ